MVLDVKKLRNEFKGSYDLVNTSDGVTLFLRKWNPPNPSNKAILIFHGVTAYSGPYELFAQALTNMGFTAIGLDLRGHGLSDGIRGDYPSKERLFKDLTETVSYIRNQFKTLLLFGHSLGVLNALIAKTHSQEKIDGLILLSAGKETRPGVYKTRTLLQKLKILFKSIITPSKPIIHYYRDGMKGLDDPLFNFYYTLRFMRLVNLKNVDLSEEINCPILFGVGEQDELFSVKSAHALLNDIPCKDKKFITIPNAKHAIDLTEEKFAGIKSWLNEKF